MQLRWRVWRLCRYLQGQGITAYMRNQFRPRPMAHRFSTAYHLVNGNITLGALRVLPAGCDQDGSQWFRPEWGVNLPDELPASFVAEIVANANVLAQIRIKYAEEGYESHDRRRLPNLADIPVSKHIQGWAIDTKVDWDALGGPWSEAACQMVARFGLTRPVPGEYWHFEMKVD